MRTLFVLLVLLFHAPTVAAQLWFESIGGPPGGPPGGRIGPVVAHPSGSVAMIQDGRLFCSSHDGDAWVRPEGVRNERFGALEREGTTLVATSGSGASAKPFLSTDGCQTWRNVTGQDTWSDRAVKVAAGWFVLDDSSRIVRSTDGGATWQPTGRTFSGPPQATGRGTLVAITQFAWRRAGRVGACGGL